MLREKNVNARDKSSRGEKISRATGEARIRRKVGRTTAATATRTTVLVLLRKVIALEVAGSLSLLVVER
jgi:hypothetical protein